LFIGWYIYLLLLFVIDCELFIASVWLLVDSYLVLLLVIDCYIFMCIVVY